ncbi:hypothetical protein DFP72DRAFT_30247 [Ephemerocybe angulata]|uniref:DH domain-containing protein n=1 Tax=Ephemerocybe angulata TaxID=980116 RepID=A0A8H6IJL2_9AGAR|nr:hypothetical protein DFP72DRAFT_30247 [Tulosesus angulatus]
MVSPDQLRAPARRKLQKAPRQRHTTIRSSPKHIARNVSLTRSASTLSDNSRGHLLPSDASRSQYARYPTRTSQPSVLRKRRHDGPRRSYHTFPPRHPGQQEHYPHLNHEALPRVPEQEQQQQVQPDLEPVSEHGILEVPRQPNDALKMEMPVPLLIAPSTSWAHRRWSSLEPSFPVAGTSTSIPHEHPVGANIQKALPALPPPPPHPEPYALNKSTLAPSRSNSLPPLPVYTAPNPFPLTIADNALHKRLCYDFIQSERVYLDTLRQCVKNEDIFVTSLDLLLSLLSLTQVAEDFATQMDANPTPKGIATSFLAVCRPLETALLKWSEELSKISLEDSTVANHYNKALPPTPTSEYKVRGTTSRRNSILKRVSVLWNRKPPRSSTSNNPSAGNRTSSPVKPDRVWQKPAAASGPGLWEMSVLPAQRVSQYRYFLREMLVALPEPSEAFNEVERAMHAAKFISEKVARAQEKPRA